ncbi:MAG: lipid-A-disaccharide synthase [Pirellulaceae bacterium]|nr:MAG: lipid-A-disaccharide synthase [Pirellulaceae bacterium]
MPGKKPTIFFSVGEPSGDLHAANLISDLTLLRPVICRGWGGPRMAAAGCRLDADLTQWALMGIRQVVGHLPHFWKLYRRTQQIFATERPDLVVLVDYPGFNWWVAWAAKQHRIPVVYYGVPQLWAWGSWRVAKARRLADLLLCKLPFEASWFQQRGCHALYVGHPYFDALTRQPLNWSFLQSVRATGGPLVTILPGSRRQEIRANLPWFLRAAEQLVNELPEVHFAVASLNEGQAELARTFVNRCGAPVTVHAGKTAELIHAADCCWACSGSVSLELLYHEKPSVILYWVPPLAYWFIRHFLIRVPFITLVNLLAFDDVFQRPLRPFDPQQSDAELVPFPEFPTCRDRSADLVAYARRWLTDREAYRRKVAQLSELKQRVAQPGASQRAARVIDSLLSGTSPDQLLRKAA